MTRGEATKIETVTVAKGVDIEGYGLFEAGSYRVEMPESYDPAAVTAADIVHDGMLVIMDD